MSIVNVLYVDNSLSITNICCKYSIHFREYLKNDNITYNDNGTASYVPKKTVMYVPEMSINDPMEDIVNVPNIPFVVSIINYFIDQYKWMQYIIANLLHRY